MHRACICLQVLASACRCVCERLQRAGYREPCGNFVALDPIAGLVFNQCLLGAAMHPKRTLTCICSYYSPACDIATMKRALILYGGLLLGTTGCGLSVDPGSCPLAIAEILPFGTLPFAGLAT